MLTTARLRRAIARDQLVLYCQPVADAATGAVHSAEALIRWSHPARGLLAPGEWVEDAESAALRNRFNLHVLALAAAHHRAWRDAGVDLPLCVNVTPECIADPAFVDEVEALFADYPPRGAIRLEITERTTAINSAELRRNAERLADLGFDLLLDDFGVGYSSLIRLAHLPVTSLKIDGDLVRGIADRHTLRAIVGSVSGLCRSLDLSIVGESVEDLETWRVLEELGCDSVQGYLIARPMPAEAMPAFLRHYLPLPPARFERRRVERRTGADRRA